MAISWVAVPREGWESRRLMGELFLYQDSGTAGVISANGSQQSIKSFLQCSPNPFNPTLNISFKLSVAQNVSLVVYNPGGRVVRGLVSGFLQAGAHDMRWDSRDDSGHVLASGMYIISLQAGNCMDHTAVVLMR